MIKIINLTPHPITITNKKTFKPSGKVARVIVEQTTIGEINGITIKEQVFKDIQKLPKEEEGTIYIVSNIVLMAAKEKGRRDVVAPDTSNAVRDENGNILSVPGFIK